ncbi:MAG: uncharacterized protein QOK05_2382 [Chloroflexota bacterium]|jgi:uncharacterized protein YciI|nr:uncharacterized protein [Chloroflexota bacterium]
MKYVLLYTSADDIAARAPEHFPAHRARWAEFHDRGELLMIGPYRDQSAALAVFTTRQAAEEFAQGDPFVVNGVVRSWEIKEWMEALVPEGE